MTTNIKHLANELIVSIVSHPEKWQMDEYVISCGDVSIWIANRPYADIKIDHLRIGTRWQRRKIRKLIDDLKIQRLRESLGRIEQVADATELA